MPSWVPLSTVIPTPPPAPAYAPLPMPPPPPMPAAASWGAAGGFTVMPPSLHWGLVLLFSWLTGGLFHLIWAFVQAGFVKKIDPMNKSMSLLIAGLVGFIACGVTFVLGAVMANSRRMGPEQAGLFGLGFLLEIGAVVCLYASAFKIRRSMMNYYNSVEPIGLRLSGAMTFFFNTLYFQHHFTRIAKWKQTGYLEPQG